MAATPVTFPAPVKEAEVQTTSPVEAIVTPAANAVAVVAFPSKAATNVPVPKVP